MLDPTRNYLCYPTLFQIFPDQEKQLSPYRIRSYSGKPAPFYYTCFQRKRSSQETDTSVTPEDRSTAGNTGVSEKDIRDTSYRIHCHSDGSDSFYHTGFQKKSQGKEETGKVTSEEKKATGETGASEKDIRDTSYRIRCHSDGPASFYHTGFQKKSGGKEAVGKAASEEKKAAGETGASEKDTRDTSYRIRCRSDGPASFYHTSFQKKSRGKEETGKAASQEEKTAGQTGASEKDDRDGFYRIRCHSDGPAFFYQTSFRKRNPRTSSDEEKTDTTYHVRFHQQSSDGDSTYHYSMGRDSHRNTDD